MLRSIVCLLVLTTAHCSVIQYRINQLEVGLEDAIHQLQERDEQIEEKLDTSVDELNTQIKQLEEALGVSVIALDVKDKQLAETLDSLKEAMEGVKRMDAQLKEELGSLKRPKEPTKMKVLRPVEASSPAIGDQIHADIMKFQAFDVMKNPHKYMNPKPLKMPLMGMAKPKPKVAPFKPLYGLDWGKPCNAQEGRIISSSSSSMLKASTGAEKATDGREHTASLTKLEAAPWYKGYIGRPSQFYSISIKGFNHFEGSIFSVYVIDTSGRGVIETKCDYSYTPYKKGDYVHNVQCNRVKGTRFKISVANTARGRVNLLLRDVKVNLCQG